VSAGYEILSVDDLDRYQISDGAPVMLPLQRRVGFEPFGVNCWTAAEKGGELIERHAEREGEEELYVVLRGCAGFVVDGEAFDAPAGSLVYVPPRTVREATGDPETVVLAMGAKPGEAWQPALWVEFAVAFSLQRDGHEPEARALVAQILTRSPGTWEGYYNAACFEARAGDGEAALALLERAAAIEPRLIAKYAAGDDDFAALRTNPRFVAVAG
jgi:hypothetical protein